MPRLIDADALGIGKANRDVFEKPEYADGWNSAVEVIENAPTIDPESLRPQGRWTAEHTCTHCGEYALTATLEDSEGEESQLYYHTPSCPWCGAKMDEEEDDG